MKIEKHNSGSMIRLKFFARRLFARSAFHVVHFFSSKIQDDALPGDRSGNASSSTMIGK